MTTERGQPADPRARVAGRARSSYAARRPAPPPRPASPWCAWLVSARCSSARPRRAARATAGVASTCRSRSTPTRWRPGSATSSARSPVAGVALRPARRGPGLVGRPAAERRVLGGGDLGRRARCRAARVEPLGVAALPPGSDAGLRRAVAAGPATTGRAMPVVVFNEKDALQHDLLAARGLRRAAGRAPGADLGRLPRGGPPRPRLGAAAEPQLDPDVASGALVALSARDPRRRHPVLAAMAIGVADVLGRLTDAVRVAAGRRSLGGSLRSRPVSPAVCSRAPTAPWSPDDQLPLPRRRLRPLPARARSSGAAAWASSSPPATPARPRGRAQDHQRRSWPRTTTTGPASSARRSPCRASTART